MKKQRTEKRNENGNGSNIILSRSKKDQKFIDYASQFRRTYRTKKAAAQDAARSMLRLDRHSKRSSCAKKTRSEIYALKKQLIEKLYKLKFFNNARDPPFRMAASRVSRKAVIRDVSKT